jgi:hypothetical protein
MGTGCSLPYGKRQEHEAHYSLPTSAEVKNNGSMHPLLPYVFMAWCLIS